jgi:glycerate dehydrogenase
VSAVFLDYDTVSTGDLDTSKLIRALPELRFYGSTDEVDVPGRIADAGFVLVNKISLPHTRLRAARHLKLIAVAGTGTDNVDLVAARELGIAVCNVPGYCCASVAQHVWALVLGLTQHLAGYVRLVKEGSWVEREADAVLALPIRELAGRRFGVVGWGQLGRSAGHVAGAFGMQVVIANRAGAPRQTGRVDLDELLATCDVVSLHCPLTPLTQGLIGARELALMKPDALLINTARGGLVDGAALARALKDGRLGGAGIDVLAREPPRHGDPLLDPSVPNLLVTPHVAWAAREARQRCLDEMAANIEDFLSGGRRARVV